MIRSLERISGAGLTLAVHHHREPAVEPTGQTIVIAHGLMDGGATWDPVALRLAEAGHDVFAPDLRGFGASDRVGAGGYYHFPDYVADLAAMVRALAPKRLVLAGHSMGATIATMFAGTLPDAAERLVLIEGIGPPVMDAALALPRTKSWLDGLAKVSREPAVLGTLDEAVRRLAFNHPGMPKELLRGPAEGLTSKNAQGELVWSYDPLHRTTSPIPFNLSAFNAFLGAVTCPTLFIGGGSTGWHVPDQAERLAQLANAQRVDIEGGGHMVHWTQPEALATHINRFAKDLAGGLAAGKNAAE